MGVNEIMKQVLITGINSYLGNQFEHYFVENYPQIVTTKISLRSDEWEEQNWSNFDAIIHVAGIAHNSANKNLKSIYYSVNRDLTVRVAEKAKRESVKHFINLSSIIVYGDKKNGINKETTPEPKNFYGDSKLQADNCILRMEDHNFKVTIIRPPMIYGENSKGNYPILAKVSKKISFFPDYPNKRSMLYVENLSELVSLIVIHSVSGLFLPQNKEYVRTSEMVRNIAKINNNKIKFITFLNPIISLGKKISLINKIFGNLYYEGESSKINFGDYQIYNLEDSIKKIESE